MTDTITPPAPQPATAPIPLLNKPRPASPTAIASMTLPRGTLTNIGRWPTRAWVPVAMPYGTHGSAKETMFLTDRGLWLRASRGEDVGRHSTMWRVFAPLAGKQSIGGTLLEPMGEKEQAWEPHPWVTDDFASIIPALVIQIGTNRYYSAPFSVMDIVDSVPGMGAMQRFHYVAEIPGSGFVREGWASFYHLSPVVDVKEIVVWSDRANPAPNVTIDAIAYVVGEFTRFDFSDRNGAAYLPTRIVDKWWHYLTGGPLPFIDGSGLPLVARMLCLPQSEAAAKADPNLAEDVNTLLSAYDGPVVGVADRATWEGKWLAHRNLPRFDPTIEPGDTAREMLDAFFADTSSRGWYGARPIGCVGLPGQTGDQEDFGSSKGTMAIVGQDARWTHAALYSVLADCFRGFLHYEKGGGRLDPAAHPGWTTWSMDTHEQSSTDMLGKARGNPFGSRDVTGWRGYDDQHRSQINLAACLALTGDPLCRYVIEQCSTVDIASHRFKFNSGSDAARAVGRRGITYALFLLLTDPASLAHQRYVSLTEDLLRQCRRDWMGAKYAHGVDILDVLTDARMGVTWGGQPLPCWSPWQNALLANYAFALWKVTRDDGWRDIARRVGKACLKYGFRRLPGKKWEACYGVAFVDASVVAAVDPSWLPGQPLPAEYYATENSLVNGGGIDLWQVPGVMVYVECTDANDPDLPMAREVIDQFTQNSEAVDQRIAEWHACVRSVPPVPGAASLYETVQS